LEAVQRAEEQKPDLILMDIGLPGPKGIQVGRLIRKVSPGSKILLVGQETSPDVVQDVVNIGAQGVLCKSDGGLLIAVDAILRGSTFPGTELRPSETLFHSRRRDT